MFAVSMPKASTSFAFVETATKCRAVALAGSPLAPEAFLSPASSHFRAVCALVIVSSVVKVFELTMKSVSSGSRSRTASTKSVPSTFETKRKVIERSL